MAGDLPNFDPVTDLPFYSNTDLPMYGVDCTPCDNCTGAQNSITVTDPNTCAIIIVGAYTMTYDGTISGGCSWSGGRTTGATTGLLVEWHFGVWDISILDSDLDSWTGISSDMECVGGTLTGTATISFGGCDAAISFG